MDLRCSSERGVERDFVGGKLNFEDKASPLRFGVRESAKARRVRLEISVGQGLVVVVPMGFDPAHIPALVETKRDWIERAFRRLSGHNGDAKPELTAQPPSQVSLSAIGEEWRIRYQDDEGARIGAVEGKYNTLLVHGNIDDGYSYLVTLKRWVNKKAHQHLVPWLRQVSEEEGLPFGKALVRLQRTRWGSCSQRGTISVNQNLLFLPASLVRYLFVHELSHTVVPNHSKRFWALVGKREPNYAALRSEIRRAQTLVPPWAAV